MAVKLDDPDVEQARETSPYRRGGWFRRFQRWVKLALAGDNDELVLENKTGVSWYVYHDYHQLGIIDAREQRTFKMVKHGSLSVRPCAEGENVDYLVLSLSQHVYRICIYQRRMGQAVEVYHMRVA